MVRILRPLYNSAQFGNQEVYQLQQSYASSRPLSELFCCMGGNLESHSGNYQVFVGLHQYVPENSSDFLAKPVSYTHLDVYKRQHDPPGSATMDASERDHWTSL